jgi:hypothetical protein
MAMESSHAGERPEGARTASHDVGPADNGVTRAVNAALQRPARPLMAPRTNAILDLLVVAVLLLAPWVLNFSDHAVAPVARTLGAMLLFYSLCTKYEFGIVRFIPLQVHLFLDLGMAVLLGAAPVHFAIWGLPGIVFVILGILMGVAALFTRHGQKFTRPNSVRAGADDAVR